MNHLIVCREYPPAPYPPGGISTYVKHIATLLAEAGETVHVVAQRWEGAAAKVSETCGGKLVVHRVSLDEPVALGSERASADGRILGGLATSDCPSRAFAWQAMRLAEFLVRTEPIDVIEGQEWEAPLYYLQLRRALGLGPRRRPPCLVHLHSPSRLIFRHNQWDVTLTDFLPLVQLEEYTVRSADALVSPSRHLALEAKRLFALPPGEIQVVPYPLGDTASIDRAPDIWARDSICYVGRTELRKGVVEWVDAAVQVAQSHPAVTFQFIGSDTSLSGDNSQSVRGYLNDRIPRQLRPRFRFHDSRPRRELFRSLAEVPVAVVPSRWDNLPYSCIEAMGTGLPVLASPNGGMAELVTHNQSGWVASDVTASALASTLRQVLDTPPAQRAALGREAAKAVRRICGNESVLQRHLELRARLVGAGAERSRQVPAKAPARSLHTRRLDGVSSAPERRGIGLVVTCLKHPELLAGCLTSIREQNRPARMVVLVVDERYRHVGELAGLPRPERWSVLFTSNPSPGAARSLGAEALFAAVPTLSGVAFLNELTRLTPHYLSTCESVFERQPGVGAMSSWTLQEKSRNEPGAGPSSALQTESLGVDSVQHAAIRAEAFIAATRSSDSTWVEAGAGELTDAVAHCGWAVVRYPDVLTSVHALTNRGSDVRIGQGKRYSVMALAQRVPANIALNWFIAAPLIEKIRWLGRGLKQPRRTARWIAWQARSTAVKSFASK